MTGDSNDPLEINPVSGNLTISGTLNNNGSAINVYGNNDKQLTLSSVLSGSGSLNVKQNSLVVVSGDNTYSGSTTVEAGRIRIQHANALGNTSASSTVNSGAALEIQGTTTTAAEALTLNGDGISSAGALRNTANDNTYAGRITLGSNARVAADSSTTLTLSGVIDMEAASADRTLTFSGAGNVTVVTGGIEDANNGADKIAMLGSGTLTLGSITTDPDIMFNQSGGIISISAASAIGVPTGANYPDKYNFLENSTLSLSAGSVTLGRQVSGADNAGFRITSGKTATFDAASGATLTIDGVISETGASGALTKTGLGKLVLQQANTYAGATAVNVGSLRISNATGAGTTGGGVTVASGAAFELINAIAVGAETLSLTGTGESSGGALRSISGNNSYAGAITLTGATRINSDLNTLTLDVASGSAIAGTAQNLTLGGAGNITINDPIATTTGTLTKDGAGQVNLNAGAVNTFTGSTTINLGTLFIVQESNLGTAPGSATPGHLTLSGGGKLEVNSTADFAISANRGLSMGTGGGAIRVTSGDTITYNGIIAGSGDLTKELSGTLVLGGNSSSYSGNVILGTGANGTLRIEHSNALGNTTGTTTVNSGNVLALAGGINTPEAITGRGDGISSGGFIRNISGNNTISGLVTINGAVVATRINSDVGTLLTLDVSSGNAITANQALTIGGAGNVTINDPLSLSSTLTKDGNGILTLAGTSTYAGGTTVSAGTLLVSGSSSSSAVALNGGTVAGAGTIGALTMAASTTVSPANTAGVAGTLTVTGAASLQGTYTCDITGTGSTACDLISASGAVSASAALTINLPGTAPGGFNQANSYSWTIMSGSSVNTANMSLGTTWTASGAFTLGTSGNTIVVNYVPVSSTIALADNEAGQTGAGNVAAGTASHVLHTFKLTIGTAATTLNQVDVTTAGTYASGDLTNLKLWYSANNTFGSDTTWSTITTPGAAGTKSFTTIGQAMAVGTYYFFVTADIASGAAAGNTISIGAIANTAITASGTKSGGPTTAGGTQTITATVTIDSTGTPAAGNVNAGVSDAVLFGFRLTPTVSIDFTALSLATAGTATSSDLSNFEVVYDADNSGTYNVGDSIVSSAAQALANPIAFTITGQTGFNSARRYLVIADVNASPTAGRTFSGSIASASAVTTTGSETGTASGNTMTIITLPTLTTPTVASIGQTSATLGANVTSLGGVGSLTSRGTVFNTTGSPVTEDALAEGGTGSGVFSHSRTLSQGTKYYYRGYAVNPAGTGYSGQGSFHTEPGQASSVTFANVTPTAMRILWTAGAASDGAIVVVREGNATVDDPTDGTLHTANAAYGSAALGSSYVVFRSSGTQVDVTGLSPNKTYYVEVFAYKGTVVDSAPDYGINYRQTTPAANSQVTPCPTITVTPATLPNLVKDAVYSPNSYTVAASGGSGSYTFDISSGGLPTGLSMNSAGVISGTPTTAGTYNFTIRATDSNGSGCTGSTAYTVVVGVGATTTNPSNQSGCVGGTATFSVTGSGNSTLYYAWSKNSNAGWGNAWSAVSGNGGVFRGTSTGNENGEGACTTFTSADDINSSSGNALGLYGNGTGGASITRTLAAISTYPTVVRVDMDNGGVDTDKKVGFSLQTSGGADVLQFYFLGGGGRTHYRYNDGTERVTGVTFLRQGLQVRFILLSSTTYKLLLTPCGGSTYEYNGTYSGTIAKLKLMNENTSTGGPNDSFFNNFFVGGYLDDADNYSGTGSWASLDKGDAPIGGATSASYTTPTLVIGDNGSKYQAAVYNDYGVARSATGTLTVNALPTITLGSSPSVCQGTTSASLTYSATSGSPTQYRIDYDSTAEAAGFADVSLTSLPASPITLTVPGAAAAAVYNGTIYVKNTTTGCEGSGSAFTVTLTALPTITLGASPSVCQGTTSANLPYTGTSGSPTQYRIDYNGTAEAAGFTDVSLTSLPSSPITLTVPGAAAAAVYNGTIYVKNAGCESSGTAFTVTVATTPTISLGASPGVCQGTTSASLTYSATSGSPSQYRIDYNGTAEAAGFTDVSLTSLPSSPITLTVPGAAAAAVYNGTIYVKNTTTGCESSGSAFTVTVSAPSVGGTATAGSSSVCSNSTTTITLTGHTGSIQWQQSGDGSSGWASVTGGSGATSSVYTTPAITSNLWYRAIVTSGSCGAATSTTASVTMTTAPTISAQPSNATICSGSSTSFTVTATGSGFSYQWRKRNGGWGTGNGWSLTAGGGSTSLGDSATNGDGTSGNINTSGQAWGLENNTGATTEAIRNFGAMSVGDVFQVDMDNGWINTGKTNGFSLRNSSNQNLVELYFNGGDSNYTLNRNGGTTDTGLAFSEEGLRIQLTVTGSSTFSMIIISGGSTNGPHTGSFLNSGPISQFRGFNAGAGSGNAYKLYFNNLKVGPSLSAPFYEDTAAAYSSWTGNLGHGALANTGAYSGATTATLTINPATSSEAGDYDVVVYNTCGAVLSSTVTLTVNPLPSITTASPLPTATNGVAYSQSLASTGGSGFSYGVETGSLPSGLTLSSGGTISGTPSGAGAYNFTVGVTNSTGCTGSKAFALTVTGGAPSTAATNLVVTASTTNTLTLTWTRGSGTNVLIVGREAAAAETPVDGTSYTANADWTLAGSLSSSKVLYLGTGTTVTVTNLTPGTQYQFAAYEFNGSGGSEAYLVGGAPTVIGYTLSTEPANQGTSLNASNPSSSTIDLAWTAATGSPAPSGYLVLRKLSSASTATPTNGQGYSVGQSVGDAVVAAIVTSGTSAVASGLLDERTYCFTLFSFRWNGTNVETRNYKIDGVIPSDCETTLEAAVIIDQFDDYTVPNALNTLNGGTGWTNAWAVTLTDGGSATVNVHSASLPVPTGYPTNSGDKVRVDLFETQTNPRFEAARRFPAFNANRIYAAVALKYEWNNTNVYLGMSFMDGTTEKAFAGRPWLGASTDPSDKEWLGMDSFGGGKFVPQTERFYGGNDYVLIMMYDFSSRDFKALIYNSSGGTVPETEPSTWHVERVLDQGRITSLNGIRVSGGGKLGKAHFDEIHVSDTWLGLLQVTDSNTNLAPTVQTSQFQFGYERTNQFTITSWQRGNGAKVLMVASASAITWTPTDGQSYTTASTTFGSGQEVATGVYVIYNGDDSVTDLTLTGLNWNNTYRVRAYEYNEGSGTKYLATQVTGNPASYKPLSPPSDITIGLFGLTGTDLSWTHWNDRYVMVVYNTNSPVTFNPTQGTDYSAGPQTGGIILRDGKVDEEGTQHTGLTAGNTIYYRFFSRNNDYYSAGVDQSIVLAIPSIIYDGFTNASSGNLNSTGGGTGWTGNWTVVNSGDAAYSSGSLPGDSYAAPSGHKTIFYGDVDGRFIDGTRMFQTCFTTGKVVLSWLQNHSYGGTNNYAGLRLMDSSTNVVAFIGKRYNDYLSIQQASVNATNTGNTLASGTGADYIYTVVYDFATRELKASAWRSGQRLTWAEPPTFDVVATQNVGHITSLCGVRLSAGANSGHQIGSTYFDEIRAGTNWTEVVRRDGEQYRQLMENGPAPELIFIGANYEPTNSAEKNFLTDAELANSNNNVDIAVRFTASPSGLFITNPVNQTQFADLGNFSPNWDPLSVTPSGENALGLDKVFASYVGTNGSTVVTGYHFNAFTGTNFGDWDVNDEFYITVSAQTYPTTGGTNSPNSAVTNGLGVPYRRAMTINYPIPFFIIDDDTNSPLTAGFGAGVITDRDLVTTNWSLAGTISDPGSGVDTNELWFTFRSPEGTTVYNQSPFATRPGQGEARTNFVALSNVIGVAYADNRIGTWTANVYAADTDADRTNDTARGTNTHEIVVIDDDGSAPSSGTQSVPGDGDDWNVWFNQPDQSTSSSNAFDHIIRNQLLARVNGLSNNAHSAVLATFTFSGDTDANGFAGPLLKAMNSALDRGALISFIADGDVSTSGTFSTSFSLASLAARTNNPLTLVVDDSAGGIMHNKFGLFDYGGPGERWVFTGSENFTGAGSLQWNIAFEIRNDAAYAAYKAEADELLAGRFHDHATKSHAHNKSGFTMLGAWGTNYVRFAPHPSSAAHGDNATTDITNFIANAQEEIIFCVDLLTLNDPVALALVAAVNADPDLLVHGVMNMNEYTGTSSTAYTTLTNAANYTGTNRVHMLAAYEQGAYTTLDTGSKVDLTHSKYLVVDPLGASPVVIHGSANFTFSAMADDDENDENILFLRHGGVACRFFEQFKTVTSNFNGRATGSRTCDSNPNLAIDGMVLLVDDVVGNRTGTGTNTIWELTDGDLVAVTASTELDMVFNVSDAYSGIPRTTVDAQKATNMNITLDRFTTNNVTNYNSAASTAYAQTTNSLATSTWTFTSIPAAAITDLLDQTNRVSAFVPDADDDRPSDSASISNVQFGFVHVVDDDTNAPSLSSLIVNGTGGGLTRYGRLIFWDFTEEDAFTAAPDFTQSKVTASDMGTSDGIGNTASGNGPDTPDYDATENNFFSAVEYYTFDLRVASGFQITITNLIFQNRASATGPAAWNLRYSGNSYATALTSGATSVGSYGTSTTYFTLSALRGTNTFRLYGTNATDGAGTWRIDNFELEGIVEPIPGSGFITDHDLANDSLAITSLLRDAQSGVYSNGYSAGGTNGPVWSLFSPSGAIYNNQSFDVGPATNGGASASFEPLEVLIDVPTNLIVVSELVPYTTLVHIVDFDRDRLNDELSVTVTSTFTVVDDDTNAPLKGRQMQVQYSEVNQSASGTATDRVWQVNDGKLRSLEARGGGNNDEHGPMDFVFYVDDDSGLVRSSAGDPNDHMNMSSLSFVTNNVANYEASRSSPGTYVGEDIKSTWQFTTALSYEMVSALYPVSGQVTNSIILDLFDADADRASDRLTTLDQQFGRWTVVDDDESAPRARTNTVAFTNNAGQPLPALDIFRGGNPEATNASGANYAGTSVWIQDLSNPANEDRVSNQVYRISDGQLVVVTPSAPLQMKTWLFDSPSGLFIGQDNATNTSVSVGTAIVSNRTSFDVRNSQTNLSSMRIATLSTQHWTFTSFNTQTVSVLYDYDPVLRRNPIFFNIFDADNDRTGDPALTNLHMGWLNVYDDDAVGPTMPGTVIYDPFTDGGHTAGSDPYDAPWYIGDSPGIGRAVVTDDQGIGSGYALQISPTNGGDLVAPVASTLSLGSDVDSIVLSFQLRIATAVDDAGGFRFGLFDDMALPVSADGTGNSDDDRGYYATFALGSVNGAVLGKDTGEEEDGVFRGDDTNVLASAGSYDLATGSVYQVVLRLDRATNGVNVILDVNGTQVLAHLDTTLYFMDFNSIAFYGAAGTTFLLDDVQLAKSAVTVDKTGWTNTTSFVLSWNTNAVVDPSGVIDYRTTLDGTLPTQSWQGVSLGLVNSNNITVTQQGRLTNHLFAIDGDADRTNDQAKGNNAFFITMVDTTVPDQATGLIVTNDTVADPQSMVEAEWFEVTDFGGAGADPLSPFMQYRVYFWVTNGGIGITNSQDITSSATDTNTVVTNLAPGVEYDFAVATRDRAGNWSPLSDRRRFGTQPFFITNGVAISANEVRFRIRTAAGGNYDLLHVNATDYGDHLTNSWTLNKQFTGQSLPEFTNQFSVTNDVFSTQQARATVRFHRAGPRGRWTNGLPFRSASKEVYAVKQAPLRAGQNWVAFPAIPDSNRVDLVLGTYLPAAGTVLNATRVQWYMRGQSNQVINATNTIWLVNDNPVRWTTDGNDNANASALPLQDGFIIRLPDGTVNTNILLVGRIPLTNQVQTLSGGQNYHLISARTPRSLHPSNLFAVVDSDPYNDTFTGGTLPIPHPSYGSDMLWKFDRDNQMVPRVVYYNTTAGGWRFDNGGVVPDDYFQPDDAIVFFSGRTTNTASLLLTNIAAGVGGGSVSNWSVPTINITP